MQAKKVVPILPNNGPDLPMPRFNVSIILSGSFSNMVLACLLEPLRVVRDRAGEEISWKIMTEDDTEVSSSSGIKVTPDISVADADPADLVLLISGDEFRHRKASVALRRYLSSLGQNCTVIAADTGAWKLALWGYLDGRAATLHWQLLDEFAETFPKVQVLPDRYVKDGRFWTCGSASAALDLILNYIGDRFGQAAAFDAGAMFLHDNARQSAASGFDLSLASSASPQLTRIIQVMSEALESTMTIAEIARAVNMSERSLHRLVLDELQMPPGKYYMLMRLDRARELVLFSDLSLNDIALRCGFAGAATLVRSFRAHRGADLRHMRNHV
jgi:transcriptional regulator GlxA family with amidase domain